MMEWLIPAARAAGPSPASPGTGPYLTLVPFILGMIVLYYFLIAMPQRKRQRERENMLKNMKRGDEVMTSGGIYGKIAGVAEQSVNLEIAPKVRIKVHKNAISQVTTPAQGEEESKEKE